MYKEIKNKCSEGFLNKNYLYILLKSIHQNIEEFILYFPKECLILCGPMIKNSYKPKCGDYYFVVKNKVNYNIDNHKYGLDTSVPNQVNRTY